MNRCDICFDPPKGGCERRNRCGTCENAAKCHRRLSPTIRITAKCTRACGHCCFSCGPDRADMMSVEMARMIAGFLARHEVGRVNVMGGEIWLNPDWREILPILCAGRTARIVSNGDFGDDLLDFLADMENIRLAISNDEWHRPKDIDGLRERIARRGIPFNIDGDDGKRLARAGIVPVGRGFWHACESMYGMFSAYCSNPANAYSFLIDEAGDIFRCPFGIWRIGNAADFPDQEFFGFFREIWGKFRSVFVAGCNSCVKAHEWTSRKRDLDENPN